MTRNYLTETAEMPKGQAPGQTPINGNLLRNGEYDDLLQYWKKELAGTPAMLQLPWDHQRSSTHSYAAGELRFTLDSEFPAMAGSAGQQPPLPATLLAAFSVLLSRYSLQDDLVIGVRSHHGKTATSLPVRFAFSAGTTFSETVKMAKEKVLSAFESHYIPFGQLARDLDPDGNTTVHPVFQVLFNYTGSPGPNGVSDTGTPVPVDLSFTVNDGDGRLECTIQYNSTLFNRDTIERIPGHYRTILRAVADNEGMPVREIPLLTPAETQLMLRDWNDVVVNYPKEKCVHHIFEEWVAKTPDAIAVEDDHTKLTYAELNEKANRLARYLVKRGAGEDTVITLFLERSVNILVGLLAISKTGATYLPLDPIYPKARLELILNDAKPVLYLTQSSLLEKLPFTEIEAVLMDDESAYSLEAAANLGLGNSMRAAYILYTSGSTGKPKGVPIRQYSLVNLVNSFSNMIGVTPDDVYLNVATIAFDIAELDMYLPLFNGARVVIASQKTVMNMDLLIRRFETCGATLFQATPVTYKMLLLNNWKGKPDLQVITGGDAMTKDQGRKLIKITKAVWNCYGPTETTIYSTGKKVTPEDLVGEGITCIGRPLDNNFMYLLSPGLVPVPVGVPGELYIGGDCVSPGYLNLPEMTAGKFIPDPFSGNPDGVMYKSGDLVKYLPDGSLIFLNRIDSQVKIRGFRIELGEIETVLSGYPGIRENVVLVKKDAAGDNMLVAYFTGRDDAAIPIQDIRNYLKERLPEYMVPAIFVRMEKFPLTANNKVDRNALPAPEVQPVAVSGLREAPRNATETKLAGIWASILGVQNAGIRDNFFELGGHSLKAAQMIVKLRSEFNADVPFRVIFEKPTIAELSEFIEAAVKEGSPAKQKTSGIPHELRSEPVPLSSAQSRIWFMEHMNPGTAAYNIPLDYRITGELDPDLLVKSLQILAERHDSLRTIFPVVDGEPFQKVLPELRISLQRIDLTNESAEKTEQAISRHSLENALFKFDLEQGPLFRFELLSLPNGEYLFLLNFHHIISDAVSIGVFMEELMEVYPSLRDGKTLSLPEIPVTYTDYSAWHNQWLKGGGIRQQLAYWKEELAGAPQAMQLPTDRPRPKASTYTGAEYHFSIGDGMKERIAELGKSQGAGLFIPMLTAFSILLSKHSAQEDLVLGVPFANRTQDETERMTGVFINNIPLRFSRTANTTFSEAAVATRNKFLAAYENQEVPFERLVDELKVKRSLNLSPLFQALFNYLTVFRKEITLPGLQFRLLNGERRTARYDITLTVNEQDDRLDCVFEYNTGLFNPDTIERLAGHYKTILGAVTEDADLPLLEIPLLTEDESTRMLNEWNSTDATYPSDRCIHQLFEDQVVRTPGSIAVVFEGQQLTYSELNARANRIAHRIARSGAKEGAIVAVCVERGIDLIASLLAVSKTGATYLPLDPIYPKARLGLILEDANPVLIISQQGLADKLPDVGTGILFLDQAAGLEKEPSGNLGSGNSQQTAYILYTSGSTGKPKGVQIRHHSVVNLVCSMGKLLLASDSDTLLAVTTISFDIAQLEMYLPLFHGGKLVIASAETQMDPALLIRTIEASGTTLFQATPVTFKMLVLNSWKGKNDLKVICGGEAMSRELAASLLAGCREVWNVYGPTETTIWSVVQKVSKEDTTGEGYVSIGKPLDNTIVYVLNPSLVPVPAGIAGELFIGGAGVSPGYLNLPDMTRDRFIPDPFSGIPDARIYRTGDLVRYAADGTLTFLNRMDSQVKIRGFRIELGEIESVLSQANGIKENVVVAREDASGEKFLAAYYIPLPGSETDEAEIRRFLKERLPDYMVPSAFVRMESFPLTANNKIDRKALPEPGSFAGQSSASYVKPSTLTEEKLARVWESVLKLDKAGIHDDFFESGGHSMIAVTLMIRIEKEFGIRLPLATLFEHSTIHGLAGIIDQQAGPVKWRSLVPIRPKGNKKPLFLIHGLGLNVLLYTTIINHLDPEQPVYGLQAKGLNGTDQPLETIEEIAAYYVSEIQSVDPNGPYSLAGFSLGGTIAFEMGRQLTESGKKVNFIGLLDSTAEGSVAHLPFMNRIGHKVFHAIRYIGWNIASFFSNPDEDMLTVFKRRLRGLEKKINGLDFKPEKNETVSKGKQSELPEYLRRVHRANRKASNNYIFRPFAGKVHLFKAKQQTFYIPDPDQYGWDKVARGGVIIHETPGEHSSTFAPPNDKYFATILQKCLNENNE